MRSRARLRLASRNVGIVAIDFQRRIHGWLVLLTLASVFSPRAAAGQPLKLVTVKAFTPDSVTAERAARVAISADGRYVAFCSKAAPEDLVPGKSVPAGASGTSNVYVRDLLAGLTTIVTLSATDANVASNGACDADVQITPAAGSFRFADKEEAVAHYRDRLRIAPGSEHEARLRATLAARLVRGDDDRWHWPGPPPRNAIVSWSKPAAPIAQR